MFEGLKQTIEGSVRLTASEWQAVETKLTLRRLKKQTIWLRAGQYCQSVAFINAGAMRCFHRKGEKDITSHLQFNGMFCAEVQSLLFHQPAAHTIETLEECELVLLRRDDLFELRRTIPAFEEFVGLVIQKFLLSEMKRTASFLLKSPDERYLELLRDLPQAVQRVPQYILASYLNMTPETFSRVRNRIRRHRNFRKPASPAVRADIS